MNKEKIKQLQRLRRKARVNIKGTSKCPRLSVFRSLKNISAQLIDDVSGRTLVAASNKDLKDKKAKKTEIAKEIGKILAKKAQELKIERIVFDKGSYKYHGRVKALAEAAREGGLEF